MIKKYLCKNDDLRYYFFLDWFAFAVLFGILTDLQFKKVYKLKKKRSVKKSGKLQSKM